MTKISGWPGTVRSGSTITRPARSSGAPVRWETIFPNSEASTPAAHSTVFAGMRSTESPVRTVTPARSKPVTVERVRARTPRSDRARSAAADRSGGNGRHHGGRFHARNDADQIAEQDKYENRPEIGDVLEAAMPHLLVRLFQIGRAHV